MHKIYIDGVIMIMREGVTLLNRGVASRVVCIKINDAFFALIVHPTLFTFFFVLLSRIRVSFIEIKVTLCELRAAGEFQF